ncbi:Probable adenine permease PurP [Flavonifractor plautii]|uniref:Probable adenine permease PurP n=1 Tax=Flavonifractor plautii TaxID=292800 RepID=A0A174LD85_FLAPL|nr:Probable adenine permease PurP [Flavonifractor plautii]
MPGFATAPALVIVGLSMLGSLRALDPADWRESLPAYLTMVAMPFCYSISEGIAVGTISYVAVHLFTGAESRKKVSPVLAILALVFLLKYIFL